MSSKPPKVPILSTAGAIPVKNEKGELTMEKVKVVRYVTGKRPEYAPDSSDEEEEEEEEGEQEDDEEKEKNKIEDETEENKNEEKKNESEENNLKEFEDRRLRRLLMVKKFEEEDSKRIMRHRQLVEPEVLEKSDDESEAQNPLEARLRRLEGEGSDNEDIDEEERERKREAIRNKLRNQLKEEEVLKREDDDKEKFDFLDPNKGVEEDEDEDYEEYEESEEEEDGLEPRLKPVFIRKSDRVTIHEKEKEIQKIKDYEYEAKRLATERRMQTLKMVEAEIKRDLDKREKKEGDEEDYGGIDSNDDNDEEQYEAWKVRELRRLKRDRDEREMHDKEKQELERLHNLTEEERRLEQKINPKQITNKAIKGKYKYLQKYYHRGAFYLDKEDTVYKRDFAAPTLDDHFNKTILPKVMQVKNFGRSGRTKYTHLVDQDTTEFDNTWIADSAMSLKFHSNKGGGMKQNFDRPGVKRKLG